MRRTPGENGHAAASQPQMQPVGTLPKRRRKQTLSLVVAASVVEVSALLAAVGPAQQSSDRTGLQVAQTQELATLVAGQIARAAAIFCLDEVVVVDDSKAGGCAAAASVHLPTHV